MDQVDKSAAVVDVSGVVGSVLPSGSSPPIGGTI